MLYHKNKKVKLMSHDKQVLVKIDTSNFTDVIYEIPLANYGIYNNNTNANSTTKGINSALTYAKEQGYKKIKLPPGTYAIDTSVTTKTTISDGTSSWTQNRKGIAMQSDMELILDDVTLKMLPTNDPYYSVISISDCKNSKIKGGIILGDKLTHDYGTAVNLNGGELELGGINDSTGELTEDSTCVRTINFIDNISYTKDNGERYEGGLPSKINAFPIINTTNNTTDGGKLCLYCYDENNTFLGKASNDYYGGHNLIEGTTKIKMVIPNDIRTDAVVGLIGDVIYYNPEFPAGIIITASNNIIIEDMEIYDCCGDCIQTLATPINATVDNLFIRNCILQGSRRQGISLTATGENYLIERCDIGNIQGTDPQAGIDIEHYKYVRNVVINKCNFYNNKTFDIVLYNGNDIEIKNNTFNGGIGETYAYNIHVHHNKFVYYDAPWLDKKHKGWGYSPSATDGYTIINDNYFEGYNVGGIGIQSKKDTANYTSMFARNTVVNCFLRLFGNVKDNTYNDCEVNYVTSAECNGERFINGTINGEGIDTSTTRTFYGCYLENSRFNGASKNLMETVFDNCTFKYNNRIFCDAYDSGVYTVKNSIITNEYTEDIPFIQQQGCTATFANCVMNLSVTKFVWANYKTFNLTNNEITFNQSCTETSIVRVFVGNTFDGNNFYKDFDNPKVTLPTSTNSTINGQAFTTSTTV